MGRSRWANLAFINSVQNHFLNSFVVNVVHVIYELICVINKLHVVHSVGTWTLSSPISSLFGFIYRRPFCQGE